MNDTETDIDSADQEEADHEETEAHTVAEALIIRASTDAVLAGKERVLSTVDTLGQLLDARRDWQQASEGDSNDAEHDAAFNMAGIVDTALPRVARWATTMLKYSQFVEQIAAFTIDGEPDPYGDDGDLFTMAADGAIDTVNQLIEQARELLTGNHPVGAAEDADAETVSTSNAWPGTWCARIDLPGPGYDPATMRGARTRLMRRARRAIRRELEARDLIDATTRSRITEGDCTYDPEGYLVRSITFRDRTQEKKTA